MRVTIEFVYYLKHNLNRHTELEVCSEGGILPAVVCYLQNMYSMLEVCVTDSEDIKGNVVSRAEILCRLNNDFRKVEASLSDRPLVKGKPIKRVQNSIFRLNVIYRP